MSDTRTADIRPTRTETKAATRLKLLDAAREIFLSVGYQGTTLDAIAAKAGFTKGAVYWHFPNKQAIFLALVAKSIEDTQHALDGVLTRFGHDPAALREHIGQWIDGIDERETLPIFGVELEVEARRDPAFRSLHQSLVAEHETALASFLRRYFAATGDAPVMPIDELAATLTTLFKGFALVRQNRPALGASSAKVVRMTIGLPLED